MHTVRVCTLPRWVCALSSTVLRGGPGWARPSHSAQEPWRVTPGGETDLRDGSQRHPSSWVYLRGDKSDAKLEVLPPFAWFGVAPTFEHAMHSPTKKGMSERRRHHAASFEPRTSSHTCSPRAHLHLHSTLEWRPPWVHMHACMHQYLQAYIYPSHCLLLLG